MDLNKLNKYTIDDRQKRIIINGMMREAYTDYMCDMDEPMLRVSELRIPETKFCPECGKKYPESENFCFDCLVKLKDIKDVNVADIDMEPVFEITKTNSWSDFRDILTPENLARIEEFDFTIDDFADIINSIKKTVLKRMDGTIKDNDIFLENLKIHDRVLLFAKSFVNVESKSYGAELGYFELNRICIDDRQLPALQITTLLHELSHFLMKEITSQILCRLLDCSKTSQIEAIAVFILSYSPINRLIDEYAAHTVEGRFTLFGYQDYSSYLNIEKEIDLPEDEIEMIKTIGNSFSNYIKDILESFIDADMLEDIKKRFTEDILDQPDYRHLALENCILLNDSGMVQAIKMIVHEGFLISMDNEETLEEYNRILEA